MDNTLTIPTVHLNGTSADDLLYGYRQAHAALTTAINAVQFTAPHGRDYYVQPAGIGATVQATNEHMVRMAKLREVQDEIYALYVAVEGQTKR